MRTGVFSTLPVCNAIDLSKTIKTEQNRTNRVHRSNRQGQAWLTVSAKSKLKPKLNSNPNILGKDTPTVGVGSCRVRDSYDRYHIDMETDTSMRRIAERTCTS
jgi:hypothetical protein